MTQAIADLHLNAVAQELVDALLDTRKRELELLKDLTSEQLLGPAMRIVEPPLWEMGHVGWFYERWILQNLDKADPIRTNSDNLYNSFNIPNAERWQLAFPSFEEVEEYITEVLNRCIQRLDAKESLTEEEIYFYRLSINHEDMHSETLHHIRQTLQYPAPNIQHENPLELTIDEDFELHDVLIPGGTYMLGATKDMNFVLDNEKWAHPIELKPYTISATPVTVAQYRAFVEAGGYQERSLWSDEGWEWRKQAQAEYPTYWQKNVDGTWQRRYFDQLIPLEDYKPMMHVNWYEASAYCVWAGRRLPSEAEWELAASSAANIDGQGFQAEKYLYPWGNDLITAEHANLNSVARDCVDVRAYAAGDSAFGVRQMLGNVWEWTVDTFDGYPDFEIDPYDTYSAPSFGQQKVLRGGCWATRSRVIRNTWRNFYTPDRNNIFAGFRTVEDN